MSETTLQGSRAHRFFARVHAAAARAAAPIHLRAATRVGSRATVDGAPHVANRGSLVVGDDFFLGSRPVQSHLVTGPTGAITIGDRVRIGAGAAIASEASITIGDDVSLGAFTMILDTDFHGSDDFHSEGARAPVVIESGATLERNVTVLRGARIGAGARVGAGSVVLGIVPPGAHVQGVPARPMVRKDGRREVVRDRAEVLERVTAVISETLAVARALAPEDGPEAVSGWDSLGTLRILLALEDEFDLLLEQDALYGVRTIDDVAEAVWRKVS